MIAVQIGASVLPGLKYNVVDGLGLIRGLGF